MRKQREEFIDVTEGTSVVMTSSLNHLPQVSMVTTIQMTVDCLY